jgi:hypothetical protein
MPKKNKMEDLRDHLFETIEMLKDPDSGMDVKKAKAIAEIGKVLVDSARTEIQFNNTIGGRGSGFISDGGNEADAERSQLGDGGYTNGRTR